MAEANRIGLSEVLQCARAHELPIWQRYKDRTPEDPFAWETVSIDGLPEVGVSHPALQQAELDAAIEAGATLLRPAKVTAFRGGSRPEIDVADRDRTRTVSARLIVAANGRTSPGRLWTRGRSKRDAVHHRIGGVLLDGVDLDDTTSHEATFPGGRTFVLPQGGGRARAYIVMASERYPEVQHDSTGKAAIAFLAGLFPEGGMDHAAKAGPIAFFPNADTWATEIAGDGIVLIGDAAGANDPSVGHGLSITFRDVRELSERLIAEPDWSVATRAFAARRQEYFATLREHAQWLGTLVTEEGPDADARRAQVERAREEDPSAAGFALIFARGPNGLVADEAARRRFFGEIHHV
jgi:2-polyprenyl-6-methoxyphenol hydroxylase-like FAD-dependent oxidoreductase